MTDNVVQISSKSDNPFQITPLELFKEIIDDIEKGKVFEPTSALVLLYRKGEGEEVSTYRYCSGLNLSGEISMLESFKFMALLRYAGMDK